MLTVCTKATNLRNNLKCFELIFNSVIDPRHLTCSISASILRNRPKCDFNLCSHTYRLGSTKANDIPQKSDENEAISSCNYKSIVANELNHHLDTLHPIDLLIVQSPKNDEVDTITSSDLSIIKQTEKGALEPCEEDVSDIAPFIMPSFNLAAYANKSETLQQLIHMGVNLHKVENMKGAGELILKLDFEKDMKMHLRSVKLMLVHNYLFVITIVNLHNFYDPRTFIFLSRSVCLSDNLYCLCEPVTVWYHGFDPCSLQLHL